MWSHQTKNVEKIALRITSSVCSVVHSSHINVSFISFDWIFTPNGDIIRNCNWCSDHCQRCRASIITFFSSLFHAFPLACLSLEWLVLFFSLSFLFRSILMRHMGILFFCCCYSLSVLALDDIYIGVNGRAWRVCMCASCGLHQFVSFLTAHRVNNNNDWLFSLPPSFVHSAFLPVMSFIRPIDHNNNKNRQ